MGTEKTDFQNANIAAQTAPTAKAQPNEIKADCPLKSKVVSAFFATRQVKENKKSKTKTKNGPVTKNVTFTKIPNALVGQKVWLVVDTEELRGKTINVEILGSKNTTFVSPDTVISVVSGGNEKSKLTATVGELSTQQDFSNTADFVDKAIIELELRPNEKTEQTSWSKQIHDSTERRAYLHLSVTADGGKDTDYNCEDNQMTSPNKEKSVFLNKEGLYFELLDCCSGVTKAQLSTLFPNASSEKQSEVMVQFNAAYDEFSIDSCLRKAHFFAQVKQEVGSSINNHEESLNYDADRLKRRVSAPGKKKGPFSYFWNHPAEADQYGRTAEHAADQEAIANRAYASRNGNGNIDSGDGWRYRGKGYIQLTGKSNYNSVQNELDNRYPDSGIDVLANGEDILTTKGAMLSAMAFWSDKGLNAKADQGATGDVVDSITRVVNANTDSYGERRAHFNATKVLFNTETCPRKP